MLSGGAVLEMPVVFGTTRVVCRLYEILTQQRASYFLRLGKQEPKKVVSSSSLLITGSETRKLLTSSSVNDYLMLDGGVFGSLHLVEKVLYCLKEEKFSMT